MAKREGDEGDLSSVGQDAAGEQGNENLELQAGCRPSTAQRVTTPISARASSHHGNSKRDPAGDAGAP